jgi:hypothetical protein
MKIFIMIYLPIPQSSFSLSCPCGKGERGGGEKNIFLSCVYVYDGGFFIRSTKTANIIYEGGGGGACSFLLVVFLLDLLLLSFAVAAVFFPLGGGGEGLWRGEKREEEI